MAAERPVDNEVLTSLRAGDPSALALVYEKYGAMVYGIALRLTDSRADAEDVLQEVFLALPESMGQLRLPSGFAGWLKKFAIRASLNHNRSRRRRRATEAASVAEPGYDTRRPDRGLRRLTLKHAIAGLPEKLRTVFVLFEVEGYRHAEIAEMLAIKPNASSQRMHRARTLLRAELRE